MWLNGANYFSGLEDLLKALCKRGLSCGRKGKKYILPFYLCPSLLFNQNAFFKKKKIGLTFYADSSHDSS